MGASNKYATPAPATAKNVAVSSLGIHGTHMIRSSHFGTDMPTVLLHHTTARYFPTDHVVALSTRESRHHGSLANLKRHTPLSCSYTTLKDADWALIRD